MGMLTTTSRKGIFSASSSYSTLHSTTPSPLGAGQTLTSRISRTSIPL